MSSLVDLVLVNYHGEWVLEGNVVKYVEHVDGDVIEAELEGCGEDYATCVIEDVVKRLGDELKIPRPVLGAIKAKLKVLGLPLVIRSREESNSLIIDFRGRGGTAQLIIRYQLVSY
jgi:hypothetical protein